MNDNYLYTSTSSITVSLNIMNNSAKLLNGICMS